MHRQPLLTLLGNHHPADANERTMTEATLAFVEENADCFERSLTKGHITGSAWVVSEEGDRIVLVHHRKLDRWLQPGGHADGDPDVAAVALREAQEETGLTGLRLIRDAKGIAPIFDVDIHTIPAQGDLPEHLHYDIRFLVVANPKIMFRPNSETKDIRWFSLKEAESIAKAESICRMLRKNWFQLRT